jgi:hypothetical protein
MISTAGLYRPQTPPSFVEAPPAEAPHRLHSFAEASMFSARAVINRSGSDLIDIRGVQPRMVNMYSAVAVTITPDDPASAAIALGGTALTTSSPAVSGSNTVSLPVAPDGDPPFRSPLPKADFVRRFGQSPIAFARDVNVQSPVGNDEGLARSFIGRVTSQRYSPVAVAVTALQDGLSITTRVDHIVDQQLKLLAQLMKDVALTEGWPVGHLRINGHSAER